MVKSEFLAATAYFTPTEFEHVIEIPSVQQGVLEDVLLAFHGGISRTTMQGAAVAPSDVRLYFNEHEITAVALQALRDTVAAADQNSLRTQYREALTDYLTLNEKKAGDFHDGLPLAQLKTLAQALWSANPLAGLLDAFGSRAAAVGSVGHLHLFNFLYERIDLPPLSLAEILQKAGLLDPAKDLSAFATHRLVFSLGPCRFDNSAWPVPPSPVGGSVSYRLACLYHDLVADRVKKLEDDVVEIKKDISDLDKRVQQIYRLLYKETPPVAGETGEIAFVPPAGASPLERDRLLARQMAPLVISHPNEARQCCFPQDAMYFWKHCAILCYGLAEEACYTYNSGTKGWEPGRLPARINNPPLTEDAVLNFPAIPPQPYFPPPRAWITACRDLREPQVLQQVPCWCEFYSEPPFLQVKYWMWWNFNDHANDPGDFGNHEGDWEHIELRVTWVDDRRFQFFYIFNRHGNVRFPKVLHWVDQTGNAKSHPKVWVAEGSHAPYEDPSMEENWDNTADSNFHWLAYDHLRFSDLEPNLPVCKFHGNWGAVDGGNPGGPASHARFDNTDNQPMFPVIPF